VHDPHEQEEEHTLVPVEPQEVVHAPLLPRQQAKPLSQTPSQSSSAPLQVSEGGLQVPHTHDELQVLVPVEPQEVVQFPVVPRQQAIPGPSSQAPLQSSSMPLHVSPGGMQSLHMQTAEHCLVPFVPQDVVHAPVSPRQHANVLSQLPSQSSSAPLQISAGGVHKEGPGIEQSIVHNPAPVEPQTVVHATSRPILQSKFSSIFPSQLSSMPLHISVVEVGMQLVSQEPSPSMSDHPSRHRTVQILMSHRESAFSPAVQTMPQPPQLRMSLSMLTQDPLQAISSEGHSRRHAPPLQTSAGAHSLPHPPQ